jgi:hypothetical protein
VRGDRSDRASLPRIRRVARPTKRLRTTAFTIDPPTPALSRRVALSAPITGGWSPLVLSPKSMRRLPGPETRASPLSACDHAVADDDVATRSVLSSHAGLESATSHGEVEAQGAAECQKGWSTGRFHGGLQARGDGPHQGVRNPTLSREAPTAPSERNQKILPREHSAAPWLQRFGDRRRTARL